MTTDTCSVGISTIPPLCSLLWLC